MQSLDVISVNLWQILISLCNLLILFLLLKKFLYKPVKKALSQRENAINEQYALAQKAEDDAKDLQNQWEDKMHSADMQADAILKRATKNAEKHTASLLKETQDRADGILRQAEADAELERKKAEADIKKEIVDVSTALSRKILEREISAEEHSHIIDEFLTGIGDDNGENQ